MTKAIHFQGQKLMMLFSGLLGVSLLLCLILTKGMTTQDKLEKSAQLFDRSSEMVLEARKSCIESGRKVYESGRESAVLIYDVVADELFDRHSEMMLEARKDCVELGRKGYALGRASAVLIYDVVADLGTINDMDMKATAAEAFNNVGDAFSQAIDMTRVLFSRIAEMKLAAQVRNIEPVQKAGELIRKMTRFFPGMADHENVAEESGVSR